jgi:alkaline phosphatase D
MINSQSNRRNFLVQSASTVAAVSVGGSLVACGGSDPKVAVFSYGVASGDPLTDRVILWTHAQFPNSTEAVALTWQVATDNAFIKIISSGQVNATEVNAFTAKVDATGLSAGNTYFYRFLDNVGTVSTVGTTRTLPATSATSVKLAVFSCTLFSAGYFNTYDAASRSDAQYAIHLGDYIYEYGSDPAKFGNTNADGKTTAVTLNRVTSPANDIASLSDYRTRYALYKSDLNLQALHAKMPWITIWDDHEFANNASMAGAQNHDTATQGDWLTRKNNAAKAYHEWMPIRSPDAANLLKIYRSFDFGNLFSLHMLDTRIEGRVQQYANFGDPITAGYAYADYSAGLTKDASGNYPDASRTMISATQQTWLAGVMGKSTATWQILGNQDVMAKMWFPASVLQAQTAAAAAPTTANLTAVQAAITDYLTAKATRAAAGLAALTPTQTALLNASVNPRLPYNLDSWDGYPINREIVLQTAKGLGKKLVALSGDSHNAWFNNLTLLDGTKVGVEFATSSVTAPGFESAGLGGLASSLDGSALVPQLGSAAIGAGLGLVDDLNYSDTIRRGYLLMTITADAVKGDYVFMDTIINKTYSATIGKTITVAAATPLTATYA